MLSLGIDVGTTTITTVAFDTARRELVVRATLPNDADCTSPDKKRLGWAELDVKRVIAIVAETLKQTTQMLGDRAQAIKRIGVTGQMHGVAFLDEHNRPVRSAITWQDQRAAEFIPDFIERLGGVGVFGNMGCLPAAGYMGPTLFWLQQNYLLPDAKFAFIPDAVVSWLTGNATVCDATNAAASGLFDIRDRRWNVDLIRRLGLPDKQLPPVKKSGSKAGMVRPQIASEYGMPKATSIHVAVGDHPASLVGSDCDAPGKVHINIGTSGQVSMIVNEFAPMDAQAGIETRPFLNGQCILTGASLCGGQAIALLRSFFQAAAHMLGCKPLDAEDAYDAMLAAASNVSHGADGLRAITLFDGARYKSDASGSFSRITRANFTPAHFTRAVLEGIAEELGAFYDAMQPHAGDGTTLIGSGNAIRRNPLLAKIVSTRFGLPLVIPEWEEEAAIGAAIVASRDQ